MAFKIFYEDDTELAEYEAINKGYRGDVIVEIEDKKYKLYITSLVRLQQDFASEQQAYGYYSAEPNTLFVTEVTKESIEKIIKEMYEEKYFERLDNLGFGVDLEELLK